MKSQYFIYILTNWANTVTYFGVTNDLERRLAEHRSGVIPGFTARYKLGKLVYHEETTDAVTAIAREKQLKGWRREKKVALISQFNPDWDDLMPPAGPSLRSG